MDGWVGETETRFYGELRSYMTGSGSSVDAARLVAAMNHLLNQSHERLREHGFSDREPVRQLISNVLRAVKLLSDERHHEAIVLSAARRGLDLSGTWNCALGLFGDTYGVELENPEDEEACSLRDAMDRKGIDLPKGCLTERLPGLGSMRCKLRCPWHYN